MRVYPASVAETTLRPFFTWARTASESRSDHDRYPFVAPFRAPEEVQILENGYGCGHPIAEDVLEPTLLVLVAGKC